MKNTVVLLAGGLAAMVTAQDQALAECSRTCLSNMRELGSDLECDAQLQGSQLLECLCKNRNYAFGVLDCTRQYCDPEVAATESDKAFEAAKAECQNVGIDWASILGTATPGANPEVSGAVTGAEGTSGTSAIPTGTGTVETNTIVGISTVITTSVPAETDDVASATGHHTNTGVETTQSAGESDAAEPSNDANPSATGVEGDDSGAIRDAGPGIVVLVLAGVAAILF